MTFDVSWESNSWEVEATPILRFKANVPAWNLPITKFSPVEATSGPLKQAFRLLSNEARFQKADIATSPVIRIFYDC